VESTSSQRFTRFSNLLINYDYKTGHYMGEWDKQYPYLINSFIEVARGIRKPSWFLSDQYADLLKSNFNKFTINFTNKMNLKLSSTEDWYLMHITPLDSIMNFYYILSRNPVNINTRWVSLLDLDQKFQKMFASSSTQQRVLAN